MNVVAAPAPASVMSVAPPASVITRLPTVPSSVRGCVWAIVSRYVPAGMLIVLAPVVASAAWTAERNVQAPLAADDGDVAQPLDGSAATASAVLATVNVAAEAAWAPTAISAHRVTSRR